MDLKQLEVMAEASETRRLVGLTEEGWMKFVVGPVMARKLRAAGIPESQIVKSQPLPSGN